LFLYHFFPGVFVEDCKRFGQTLEEEKQEKGEWPDYDYNFQIENCGLRVFGGAQYRRLLTELSFLSPPFTVPN
jgi:hypothetical protein